MGREDEAGRCEDGQMIIYQGLVEQISGTVGECSQLARDRQQWRLLVHEMISDPQ